MKGNSNPKMSVRTERGFTLLEGTIAYPEK
jgi:hypothetical protein